MHALTKLLFTTALLYVFIEAKPTTKQHDGSCRSRNMYIPWEKVRNYLNKNLKAAISGTIVGEALKVKRCRSFLSPCNLMEKAFCGVKTERIKKQNLKVVNERQEEWNLTLHFVEDDSCECMERNEYNKHIPGDVADTPYIFNLTWTYRKRW